MEYKVKKMVSDDGIFIDENSYNTIWNDLIERVIKDYSQRFAEIIVSHNAKELIWEEYLKFNKHCKLNYMCETNGKLDRHKVCACYMFAIVKANTLNCGLADCESENKYLCLNENLAVTVGMSLLRAFVVTAIHNNDEYSEKEKEELKKKIDNGIIFPKCNHGDYRENFVTELHFAREENNYNVLSLANTLFLLEIHSLGKDVVCSVTKKKE